MDPAGFGREIVTAARPAGFTTGVTDFSPGATPRRLELLKELVPNLWRVGVLYHPQSSWVAHWSEVEAAARAMGVSLERIEWNASSNPGDAFHIADKRGVRVLMTLGGVNAYLNRELVFELAAQYRMPVLYDFPMFPTGDEVGLIAYYADATAMYITVAEQVDQILRGRKPGDIPLALPQTFRLVINAKAARALGLSISPSLRRQANEVIE
jgi:putative ABC transport system substrate-binding protein